jgi:hypothetical protein
MGIVNALQIDPVRPLHSAASSIRPAGSSAPATGGFGVSVPPRSIITGEPINGRFGPHRGLMPDPLQNALADGGVTFAGTFFETLLRFRIFMLRGRIGLSLTLGDVFHGLPRALCQGLIAGRAKPR